MKITFIFHFFKEQQTIIYRRYITTTNHKKNKIFGGGERDRTDDPLLAKQVLSQLSYTPNTGGSGWT